jgi:hypothetical protein
VAHQNNFDGWRITFSLNSFTPSNRFFKLNKIERLTGKINKINETMVNNTKSDRRQTYKLTLQQMVRS